MKQTLDGKPAGSRTRKGRVPSSDIVLLLVRQLSEARETASQLPEAYHLDRNMAQVDHAQHLRDLVTVAYHFSQGLATKQNSDYPTAG